MPNEDHDTAKPLGFGCSAGLGAGYGIVCFIDATKATPQNEQVVIVKLSDGEITVAHYSTDGAWVGLFGGGHPGDWTNHGDGTEGRDEVAAWAYLPEPFNLSA